MLRNELDLSRSPIMESFLSSLSLSFLPPPSKEESLDPNPFFFLPLSLKLSLREELIERASLSVGETGRGSGAGGGMVERRAEGKKFEKGSVRERIKGERGERAHKSFDHECSSNYSCLKDSSYLS